MAKRPPFNIKINRREYKKQMAGWRYDCLRRALLYAVLILATVGTGPLAPPARAQDILTGLIGYWKLDGNAFDYSGSGANDGTVQGGAGYVSGGKYDGAIELDGVDDYVDIGDPADGSLDPGTGDFSLALWVKVDDASTFSVGQSLITKGNWYSSNRKWFSLDRHIGGGCRSLRFYISDGHGSSSNVNSSPGCSGFPWNDTGWHHVAVSVDRDGSAVLYVDGAAINSASVSANSGDVSTAGSFFIGAGRSVGVADPGPPNIAYFDGQLDDVRYYNRALTAEDISALPPRPGQFRYSANHRVPEYYNGTQWIAATQGPYVAGAVKFDGASYLTGTPIVPNGKQITLSFWAKFNDLSNHVLLDATGPGSPRITIGAGGGRLLDFTQRNASGTDILHVKAATSFLFDDLDWHHVLISADLSDPAKRHFYIDDADQLSVVSYVDDVLDNSGTWYIGAAQSLATISRAGLADFWLDSGTYIDFSVEANRRKFTDADGSPVDLGPDGSRPTGTAPEIFLSGDTAGWHINKGTGGGFTENGALTDATTSPGGPYAHVPMDGLVGWWRMDETSGSAVIDYVSASNGTFTSGGSATNVQPSNGVFSGALRLDGADDRIDIPSTSDITNIFDGGGTVAFWVYPQEKNPGKILPVFLSKRWTLTRRDNVAGETGYDLRVPFSTQRGVWRAESTTPPIAYNTWSHVTVVYNADSATNSPAVYVNGVLQSVRARTHNQ